MADGALTNPSIDRSEHVDENVSAKRTASYTWDGSNWQRQGPLASGMVSTAYDYVSVAYPDGTTETYTFKTGGSGGTTVATVTLTYTDSTKASLNTVARS